MLKGYSLKTKMMTAFSAVAFAVFAVGLSNFLSQRDLVEKFNKANFINSNKMATLIAMRAAMKDTRELMYKLGLPNNTPAENQSIKGAATDLLKKHDTAQEKYQAGNLVDTERDLFTTQADKWKPFESNVNQLLTLSRFQTPSDRTEYYAKLGSDFKSSMEVYSKDLQNLVEFETKEVEKLTSAADSAAKFGNVLSIILVAVGFIFAQIIGIFFSSSLSKQLGNLASNLSENANSVATASKSVSTAGSTVSSSSAQQAAALQETVASIDEVSAMVNKNADNAKRSQDVSIVSQNAATKGKEVVEAMIQSIDDINRSNNDIMQQIEASNQQISDIVKVIAEIGTKTKVINDIVFQTKLLSFNASVEAARAGEHGKGFAVVAEEVGNLAQMSGNAAKEISQMLEGSIQKVEGIVSDTKSRVEKLVVTGREKVQAGTQTAKRCGEVLDDIVKNVTEVNQMIAEISTASSEQAQGVHEINKAMSSMDQITQQNAATSQEVATAAEQLTNQAESLRGYVNSLMATVKGGGGSATDGANYQSTASATSANSGTSNVVQLKRVGSSKRKASSEQDSGKSVPSRTFKKAVGSDVPSQDDPRFEDI